MANNSWKHLELWERVKWARSRRFASAVAAAAALGMKDGTYRCYERGPDSAKHITLDYKYAREFARVFEVRWEWLLDGLGAPWLNQEDADEEEAEPKRDVPNFIRAWRVHRGLTVAELSKKSGVSVQTINDLESGARDVAGKLLMPLADALDTSQGYLLDHDPGDVDPTPFVETVRAIPKERRSQALEILKTFRPYNRLR
jgi:transcriptional regulator with XRE-family HTH domain